MNFPLASEMIGEGLAAVEGVEVSDLGIVVEPQKERDPRVLGILPDDDAILIPILLLRLLNRRLRRGSGLDVCRRCCRVRGAR